MIELLVVVAIIAILAGLLMPAIISGMKQAEITQAKTDAKLLEQAINSYRADYQKFPGQFPGRGAGPYQDYNLMVATLQGSNVTGTAADFLTGSSWKNQNPRQKAYLQVSDKFICTNGTVTAGGAVVATKGDLMDPWGNRYMVVVDFDSKGTVDADGETVQREVAVWSWGPNPLAVPAAWGSVEASSSPTNTSHIRSWRN